MWKINLVLADVDERYIESLSKFIRSSYMNKFNLNVFTQKDSLVTFLNGRAGKIDILIVAPELFSEEMKGLKAGIIIILSNGNKPESVNGIPCINKYQTGDLILNSVLELFSDTNPGAESILRGSKNTVLISVYSPIGGSGKTTISLGLSALFAKKGMKTLYLNLETINSIPYFIKNSNQEIGMSNLLFYLKENKKNLSIKIDALKSYDRALGISYFNPADFSLEIDELTEFDIGTLLFELKEVGQFDVVVTDTDSVFNRRNLAVLNSSDSIIMPVLQGTLAKYKLEVFERELKKINSIQENALNERITPVINRFQYDLQYDEFFLSKKSAYAKIPLLKDMNGFSTDGQVVNNESIIFEYLEELSKAILYNKYTGSEGHSVL